MPAFEFEMRVGDGITATVSATLEDGPDPSGRASRRGATFKPKWRK